MLNKINTPELDKMLAVKNKSQAIGEFLEWLESNDMTIARYATKDDCYDDEGDRTDINEGDYLPVRLSIENMLAKYFGLDLNKAEKEKQALLESLKT